MPLELPDEELVERADAPMEREEPRQEQRNGLGGVEQALDTATVADRATYREPTLLAVGMRYVLVNGALAIDGGNFTGAMAGRALRRTAATH